MAAEIAPVALLELPVFEFALNTYRFQSATVSTNSMPQSLPALNAWRRSSSEPLFLPFAPVQGSRSGPSFGPYVPEATVYGGR